MAQRKFVRADINSRIPGITSHAPLFCHNKKFDTVYRCRCTNSNRYADQILSLSLPDFFFLLPLFMYASNYGGNITLSLDN